MIITFELKGSMMDSTGRLTITFVDSEDDICITLTNDDEEIDLYVDCIKLENILKAISLLREKEKEKEKE